MIWQEIILLTTTILVITEQKPSIYFESETDLLEEIRGIRNTDNEDVIFSSQTRRFYKTDTDDIVPIIVAATSEKEEIKEDQTIQINEDDSGRKIRDIEGTTQKPVTTKNEDSSSEETTVLNEETTTVDTRDKIDIFAIFVKLATKNFEDDSEIQRRSIKEIEVDEIEGDGNEEDLDTAANTVFRPLFAYRQQEARRRRFRTLNN